MWHVTRDMWHVGGGGWTFSQNYSSLALTVSDLWYYEDMEEKADLLTDWIYDEAVYRTAPATPGLLIFTSLPGDKIFHKTKNVINRTTCWKYNRFSNKASVSNIRECKIEEEKKRN